MTRYTVRTLHSSDFASIMEIEDALFGGSDDGVLGPYYIRLCCEFFRDSSFVVEVEGKLVGYLLSFVRDRECYCTTLGLLPAFQGTRALPMLLKAFIGAMVHKVDLCWFTVEEDNAAARALHARLGAREVAMRPDFYGPGRDRLVSLIDRPAFDALRSRFQRLGLVEGGARRQSMRAAAEVTPVAAAL